MTAASDETGAMGADIRQRRKSLSQLRLLGIALSLPLAAAAVFAGGFLWFALQVASKEMPLDDRADGIVALTGGASRISDAVELLASGVGSAF